MWYILKCNLRGCVCLRWAKHQESLTFILNNELTIVDIDASSLWQESGEKIPSSKEKEWYPPSDPEEPNGQKLELQPVSVLGIFLSVVSLYYFWCDRKTDLVPFSFFLLVTCDLTQGKSISRKFSHCHSFEKNMYNHHKYTQ